MIEEEDDMTEQEIEELTTSNTTNSKKTEVQTDNKNHDTDNKIYIESVENNKIFEGFDPTKKISNRNLG